MHLIAIMNSPCVFDVEQKNEPRAAAFIQTRNPSADVYRMSLSLPLLPKRFPHFLV